MWILKHGLGTGGESHYLLPGKEYVVGRKNCDVLLSSDQSISRAHATLTATDQTLRVKDSSKYGTFVNEQRLSENISLRLKQGDLVTFGVFESKFSVDRIQLVVCSSCVDTEGKARLSQALLPLGGKLVNSWTDLCTHLVMPTVKVTIKTISALLSCRPIITEEFISELSTAVQQKSAVPDADSFIPELDEPSLNRDEVVLTTRAERRRLFDGKTFVFLSNKQLKRLSAAVSLGGGRSELLAEGSLPLTLLQSPHSCVVDVISGNSQASVLPTSTVDWAGSVRTSLHQKGLRLIPESEIGLAAIYICCDKYCNPSTSTTDTVGVSDTGQSSTSRIPSATLSQNAVEETVLPGESLNITAYAVNTEPSQSVAQQDVAWLTAVGETPEKRQGDRGSSVTTVAESISSTLSSAQNTAGAANSSVQRPVPPKAVSGGTSSSSSSSQKQKPLAMASPQKQTARQQKPPLVASPQKQKPLAMASPLKPTARQKKAPVVTSSPQKQTAVTSFFQPVSKKRPRSDDASSPVVSKRAAPPPPPPSSSVDLADIPLPWDEFSSSDVKLADIPLPPAGPPPPPSSSSSPSAAVKLADIPLPPRGVSRRTAASSTDLGGASRASSGTELLFPDQSDQGRKRKEMDTGLELLFPDQPDQGRKRKEMGTGLEPDELESIMSQDMDDYGGCEDDNGDDDYEPAERSTTRPDRLSSKRVRLNAEGSRDTEEQASSNRSHPPRPEEQASSNRSQKPRPAQDAASNGKSDRQDRWQVAKDEEVSFAVPSGEGDGVAVQSKASGTTKVKLETPLSVKDENHPQTAVLIEFKSLTVTAPSRDKPRHYQGNNGSATNFKRFRKVRVSGAEGRALIIGASDLLVYNRSSNAELDEWMKDVAEEDRQNKNDENLGDDLFRYNPTTGRKK